MCYLTAERIVTARIHVTHNPAPIIRQLRTLLHAEDAELERGLVIVVVPVVVVVEVKNTVLVGSSELELPLD